MGVSLALQKGQKERGRGQPEEGWDGALHIMGHRACRDPDHIKSRAKYCLRFWQIHSKASSCGKGAFQRGELEELHLHHNGPSEASPCRFDLMSPRGNRFLSSWENSTTDYTHWGLTFPARIEEGRLLGLHGIPNSHSKKKIAFVHVINNNAFGPGNH